MHNKFNLRSVLPAMGISDAFNPTASDFTGISGQYIHSLQHVWSSLKKSLVVWLSETSLNIQHKWQLTLCLFLQWKRAFTCLTPSMKWEWRWQKTGRRQLLLRVIMTGLIKTCYMILLACQHFLEQNKDLWLNIYYVLTLQRWCYSNDPVLLFSRRTGRFCFFYDRLTQVFILHWECVKLLPTPVCRGRCLN